MLVKGQIENEKYQKLIKYAFQRSDAIMFVIRKGILSNSERYKMEKKMEIIKRKLSKSFLKQRNGSHWVFTRVGYKEMAKDGYVIPGYNDPPDFDNFFEILFYKTDEEVEKYILTNKSLYNWLEPKYPEDISFFKDGYCWLYSVAHEDLCEIYCDSSKEYEYLKSIGIDFWKNEYIPVSKKELYYENYFEEDSCEN